MADPAALHVFDPDHRRSGGGLTPMAATRRPRARRRRSPRPGAAVDASGASRTCCCCPSLLIFGVFVFWPLIHNVYLGFFRNPPFPGLPKHYVGFDQYRDVLTSYDFLDSVKTTILFALLTVPVGIVLGLGLAVLAHQQLQGIGIYRTIFSSTVATSVAVAAVIFGTLMNPQVGLLPWLGLTTNPTDPPEPALGAAWRSRSPPCGRRSASRSS